MTWVESAEVNVIISGIRSGDKCSHRSEKTVSDKENKSGGAIHATGFLDDTRRRKRDMTMISRSCFSAYQHFCPILFHNRTRKPRSRSGLHNAV